MEEKQNIFLEDRKKMTVTGVTDVESFHEEEISLETGLGMLLVKGAGLKINKLNVDTGELAIEGEVDSVAYSDRTSSRGSFLSRMFR